MCKTKENVSSSKSASRTYKLPRLLALVKPSPVGRVCRCMVEYASVGVFICLKNFKALRQLGGNRVSDNGLPSPEASRNASNGNAFDLFTGDDDELVELWCFYKAFSCPAS